MGATVSGGEIKPALEKATLEELQKAAAELSPEDIAKLQRALAPPDDAAGPTWKMGAVPDGGMLLCCHPGSGNAIPVMLFGLKYMKDKYAMQMCNIMKGEQNSPDFLAMNPFHQIPSARMSDGTNLFESSAMLRYLAGKYAPETYPAEKQLIIDMAMDKRQTDLNKAWGPIGYYLMGLNDKPGTDAAKKLNAVLTTMEKAFLTGKYVGGDTMSIADFSILPWVAALLTPTCVKTGYKLPARWVKFVEDAKADLGDVFTEGTKAAMEWVGGNESKMEVIAWDADEEAPAPHDKWKIEAPPEDGILVCGHPGSCNVIGVMLFGLVNMKDKYKFQMANIMEGEQMGADFIAMNPFHQVPSAKMGDGTCMYESNAMLRYLAQKYAKDAYPAEKQLILDMALDKRQTDLYKAWSVIAYYAMGIAPAPGKEDAKKLNTILALMEKAFLAGKFIGGDKMTIADYSLVPLINTLSLPVVKKIGYTLPERWVKYLEDVKAATGECFAEAVKVHEGWVGSNDSKVETIAFDA